MRFARVPRPKQYGFCFGDICRKDQDIEIAKLALGHFSIESFRQDRTLEGQSLDSGGFKMVKNASQFPGKPQRLARVVLVARAERVAGVDGNQMGECRKSTVHRWDHAVVVHETKHSFPIQRTREDATHAKIAK